MLISGPIAVALWLSLFWARTVNAPKTEFKEASPDTAACSQKQKGNHLNRCLNYEKQTNSVAHVLTNQSPPVYYMLYIYMYVLVPSPLLSLPRPLILCVSVLPTLAQGAP